MSAAAAEVVEVERQRLTRDAIDEIRARYRCTLTELSLALGAHAPERGARGGTPAASRWYRGEALPGTETTVALLMLAQGRLALRQTGRDGRRKLFRVVVPE